ncbi:MAG TPA: hypothetical protein VE172_05445 [Stackebrandtia sp.]|jgi:phenylacetic acid degradation operon negative regulatory protein|uniref:hypothetical protein n=1 Tax=Stackebrandtia sp. TaxID=2023065 RepID=UPI002D676133|nr:hypothetical protein [Stackebrandtia sp.]HZE38238.1 hypothetical protein [Stackebrandtia sp.]
MTVDDEGADLSTAGPRGLPSAGNVPFLFGICRVTALPGPILADLLMDLGMTRSAARTLLSRLRRNGSLSVVHSGRVGVYRMAGHMAAGFQRVRHGFDPPDWDGRFHTVVFDLAESQRGLKDRLRYTALLSGYGQLRSGMLINPFDRGAQLDVVLRDGIGDGFVAYGRLEFDAATARRVAARVWNLPRRATGFADLAARIRAGLRDHPAPADGAEALRRFHSESMAALSLMLTFPRMPVPLLPDGWPAADLDGALDELAERLIPAAAAHLSGVLAASPHRDLVAHEDTTVGRALPPGPPPRGRRYR